MHAQHYATLVTGVIECFLFTGIMFGWSSFSYVLVEEGYFNYTCNRSTEIERAQTRSSCATQQSTLELIYALSGFLTATGSVLVGWCYDQYGTWAIRTVLSLLFVLACVLTAFITRPQGIALFVVLPMLKLAGCGILLSNIAIAKLFHRTKGTVISVINGAYDSSGIVLLFVKIAYENNVPVKSVFLFMAFCGTFLLLRTYFLMPRMHIPDDPLEEFTYGIGDCRRRKPNRSASGEDSTEELLVQEEDHTESLWVCVKNVTFCLHTFHLSAMQLRLQFVYGTLYPWLEQLTRGDTAELSKFINIFAITQLCGILFSPFIGLLFDVLNNYYKKNVDTLKANIHLRTLSVTNAIVSSFFVIVSVFTLIPSLQLQYATFVLIVLSRAMLYTTMSTLVMVYYPREHFGKIYTITLLIASIVCFLQYPLYYVVATVHNGDFVTIDIILLCLTVSTFAHPVNLYFKSKLPKRTNNNHAQINGDVIEE